jgi:hypothetical protein
MDFMSIIKFEVSAPEAVKAIAQFKENRLRAFNQLSKICVLQSKKLSITF